MMYLHANDLIHRELKPENIFLDGFLFPKIGDFGLLTQFWSIDCISHQSISGLKGTPTYSAPEVLLDNSHTKKGDVYAFAYIVYEIVTCKIPFGEIIGPKQIFNEVVEKENRPKIDESVPDCYRLLIERCWAQDPNERPTFAEIVELLKMNDEFITEKVNKDDYFKYVKLIEKKMRDLKLYQKIDENTDQQNIENNNSLNHQDDENADQKVAENDESFNKNAEESADQQNIKYNNSFIQQDDENTDQQNMEYNGSLNKQDDENANQKVAENDESFNKNAEENDESLSQKIEENHMINDQKNNKISDSQTDEFIEDEDHIDYEAENEKDIAVQAFIANDELCNSANANDKIFSANTNDDSGTYFNQKDPTKRSISLDDDGDNKQHLIEKFIASKKADELMNFLNNECDYETTSSAFDRCLSESPEIYMILCTKGISLNNAVAYHKHALYILLNIDETKSKEEKCKIVEMARSQLEKSAKYGFNFSYFSLARLAYEVLKDEKLAFDFASMGSKRGDAYSMSLLGFFKAHGIGTEKNHHEGVKMMLESGADALFDNFATDIGIYYVNQKEDQKAFEWFQKAFDINKTKASVNNLGICFLKGIGVKKDIQKAKEIFTLGASNGDKNAIYHLDFIIKSSDLDNSLI